MQSPAAKPTVKPKQSDRTLDKFVIRMPSGLRSRIYDQSKANRRSMNSEIINRLSQEPGSDYAGSHISAIGHAGHDVIVGQVNTALAMRNKHLEDLLTSMPADIQSQEMAAWHTTIATAMGKSR